MFCSSDSMADFLISSALKRRPLVARDPEKRVSSPDWVPERVAPALHLADDEFYLGDSEFISRKNACSETENIV